jgi:hypothetical protein
MPLRQMTGSLVAKTDYPGGPGYEYEQQLCPGRENSGACPTSAGSDRLRICERNPSLRSQGCRCVECQAEGIACLISALCSQSSTERADL